MTKEYPGSMYYIVRGYSLHDLSTRVEGMLKIGYTLQGGATVDSDTYIQAVFNQSVFNAKQRGNLTV